MILMADIITPITGTDTIRRCGSSGRQNEERMASCCRVEAARNLTMTLKQPSAAVAASMGKAKLAGLIVDRSEQDKPGDFDDWTTDQLREFILSGSRASGSVLSMAEQSASAPALVA